MPASRQATGVGLPCAIDTSIWRSSVTICSAPNLFFGMTGSFPSSFSHNAWSKKARSGQLEYHEQAKPWQNGHVERRIGSIRRECADHLIVLNEEHLRRILAKFFAYYNGWRPHVSLGKD